MITENLSTLKINKLTQKQYERELAAGRIDENALYLTPDEGLDKYIGDPNEIFDTTDSVYVHEDNVYYTMAGETRTLTGCNMYRLHISDTENSHLIGKTIKIKTYAYGGIDMDGGMTAMVIGDAPYLVNPNANIQENPASGVCELELTIPDQVDESTGFNYNFPFVENNGYTELKVYELKGSVWEEIKKLQSIEGFDAAEIALTAVRYEKQSLTEEQKAQVRENIGVTAGGGGITVTDDGNGNVTISASGGVSVTDDGNGNVTIG